MIDSFITLDIATTPTSSGGSGTHAAPKKARVAKAPKAAVQASATTKRKPTTASPARPTASKPADKAKPPAAAPIKPAVPSTGKPPKAKLKLVRDSFTMPQADFELIDVLKHRAMNFRHAVKKSELLRAGLQVLATLPDVQLEKALSRITPLKTGRPKKAG
jgi:hypothetical protein